MNAIINVSNEDMTAEMQPGVILEDAAKAMAQCGLVLGHATLMPLVVLMTVYFVGFNLIEAMLPSLVSRIARADRKGTALAAFATAQYLGAFVGGPLGGWLYGAYGIGHVFGVCFVIAIAWLAASAGMRNPPKVVSRVVALEQLDPAQIEPLTRRLLAVRGVRGAIIVAEERAAYVKVDPKDLDAAGLRAIAGGAAYP